MKTIFMPQDLLTRWVADLRANPHLQGYGTLETDKGKFCCLGRLQVVASGCTEKGNVLPSHDWLKERSVIFTNFADYIVRQPFLVEETREERTLDASECNDMLKLSFSQIADLIEYNYGGAVVL